MNTKTRTALIGWIWLATCVDLWTCQFLVHSIELNPLASVILSRFGVWGLVSAKVFGTWVATEWLRFLPIGYSWAAAVVMAATLGALFLL